MACTSFCNLPFSGFDDLVGSLQLPAAIVSAFDKIYWRFSSGMNEIGGCKQVVQAFV
jgi:hypothetical protein